MKAVCIHTFGEPEVRQLEEVPDPQPGPGRVVVRVHAVGVNPVETYIRSGIYPKPSDALYAGQRWCRVIAAVGPDVKPMAVGDRVYIAGSISGTYAEKSLCLAARVHPLPQQASFAQGAAINVPYGTAYHALLQWACALPGESVLVHGASGGVGIAAVQLACAAGMTVIGTASTERGRHLVLEQGAHLCWTTAPQGTWSRCWNSRRPWRRRYSGDAGQCQSGERPERPGPRGRVVTIGNQGPGNQGTATINARA